MIGKLGKGTGALGLMQYLLRTHDHNGEVRSHIELIGGTFSGQTPREIGKEFEAFHTLRPTLKRHVVHMSLRLAPGDRTLSIEEWRELGTAWAQNMGFDGYAIVMHGNHIHIACSRIKLDGSIVSDGWDWRRSEAIIRDLEHRHGLHRVEPSHLLEPGRARQHRKSPGLSEIALAERGQVPTAEIMRDLLDAALARSTTITQFIEHLESAGVDVRANIASTGRLSGFSYAMDHQLFTAKGLGRKYTYSSLIAGGLTYEPDRDAEAIERTRGSSKTGAYRGDNAEDRSDGTSRNGGQSTVGTRSGKHSSLNHTSGTQRRPHDRADQRHVSADRDEGGVRRQANQQFSINVSERSKTGIDVGEGCGTSDQTPCERYRPNNSRNSPTQSTNDGAGIPERDLTNIGGGDVSIPSRPFVLEDELGPAPDTKDATAWARYWARWAAILKRKSEALSALQVRPRSSGIPLLTPAPWQLRPGPAIEHVSALTGIMGTPGSQRTLNNLIDQVAAFRACGADVFEVQPIPPKGSNLKPERIREWTAETLCTPKTVGWLRKMNAGGHDIYIRPAPRPDGLCLPLAFLDDMDADQVLQIEKAGIVFAILVESSAGRYHGWTRLSHGLLKRDELTSCGRELSNRFETDSAAIDWRRFGRACGFTNRKPSRVIPGRGAPFALMRKHSSEVSPLGAEILAAARSNLARATIARPTERTLPHQHQPGHANRQLTTLDANQIKSVNVATAFLDARAKFLQVKADGSPDHSSRDFSAVLALMNGGFDDEQIALAMYNARPDLNQKANSRAYVDRTIEKARGFAYGSEQPAYRPRPNFLRPAKTTLGR